MKKSLIAAALVVGSAHGAFAGDVDNAYQIGEVAKKSGMAVDYSVSGWGGYLDLNISSMLPGDARNVASIVCQFAREKQKWERSWTVRVFLVTGERPAAQCSTKS